MFNITITFTDNLTAKNAIFHLKIKYLYSKTNDCVPINPAIAMTHKSSNFIFNPIKPFAMKSTILLLAFFTAVFSSCTSAYKTGQTPDDVYYSPERPQDEYVQAQKQNDRYQYSEDYYDDRYLRMKVANPYLWNDLNDWYSYERYGFGQNYYYGSYYNPYNSWNYYYNPYCHSYGNTIVYSNPKTTNYKPPVKPRVFNLAAYTNTNYNNNNNSSAVTRRYNNNAKTNSYNNSNRSNNSNNGLSNTIRTILSGSNNSSGNSGRTYNPSNSSSSNSSSTRPSSSSSSSSSGSSSSSSGGSVSRPSRGNN